MTGLSALAPPEPKTVRIVREFVAVYTRRPPEAVTDDDVIPDDHDLRADLAGIVRRHYHIHLDVDDMEVFGSVDRLAAAIDVATRR